MTVPPAEATKKGWRGTITNLRQQGGKGGNSPNPTISFSTNQPINAPSLAARKHYRVGQSNLTFLFRQGSSRGKGGRRAAPPLAARAGESQVFSRGWVIHRGVWGGHPLTLSSTNPVQGMEGDGALGSTTSGVMEGVGTPAACSNNREGKGGTPSQGTRGKILLNGWPPP